MLIAVIALAFGCDDHPVDQPSPLPCAFALSASAMTITAAGGSGAVSVSTEDRCAWSAQANVDWISITGGTSLVGPGTVAFTVSANSETSARTGTLTVADKPVSVTQDASVAPTPCTFVVAPTSVTFDKRGGTDHVTVTAPETCGWTALSTAAWLHIMSGAQGSGSGTVTYSVDANADPAERASTIAVADGTIAVSQAGDLDRCEYSISVLHFSPCMLATELTATITTAAACPWTASSNASWMTLTRGGSTLGSGVLGFTVSENYDLPRAAQILVRWPAPTAGQNLQVSQAGCRYGVSTTAIAFPANGGSGSFDVVQQSDPVECAGPLQNACVWSAQSDVPWITITNGMPRVGDDPVFFTVSLNPTTIPRTGTITVRDQVVRITQGRQPGRDR